MPHVLEAEARTGERLWIDLHAHGRLLTTAQRHETDAGHLRDLLSQNRVGIIVDLAQGNGVRADAENENRRISWVALAVGRRGRKRARQEVGGRIDRRLYVLFCGVDVSLQVELKRDLRATEAAHRRHLRERRHLAELSLERRRDGRRHGVRAGSRQVRGDDDRWIIDLRQSGDGKLAKADDAGQEKAEHQQGRRDRPSDERLGDAHGRAPASGAGAPDGGAADAKGWGAIFAPGRS